MKFYLIIFLFLIFSCWSFGQKPSASPTPSKISSPENTKPFGSSLKRYENKNRQFFQANKKIDEPDDDETIRIKTDLVANDVLVTDENGNIITNLKEDDFIVTENSVPQKIEMFSASENETVPRSIVLIIDYSTSLLPYIKNSIEAAKLMIDKLNPQDRVAIVTDDVELIVNFTTDKNLLKKKLNTLERRTLQITNGGKSKQFSALLAVLNEMFKEKNIHPVIIFQTDGDEISMLKEDNDNPFQVSKMIPNKIRKKWITEKSFGFGDIKEAIEKSRATIYSIVPGVRFLGFSKEQRLERSKLSLADRLRVWRFGEEKMPVIKKELQEREAEWQLATQTAMFKVAEWAAARPALLNVPKMPKMFIQICLPLSVNATSLAIIRRMKQETNNAEK